MNQRPEELTAAQLRYLLENNAQFKAEFDNYIQAELRRQYVTALQELNKMMQNPERNKDEVLSLSSKVSYPGKPTVEDLSALIELERHTRQARGTAYHWVEKTVLKQLSDLIKQDELIQNEKQLEELLAFLKDTFYYTRKYDKFAPQRRFIALKMTARIAIRSENEERLALLHEALADSTAKIRGEAIIHIYEAYEWLGCDMPTSFVDRFKQMADSDRSKKVRQIAQTVLRKMF